MTGKKEHPRKINEERSSGKRQKNNLPVKTNIL